MNNLTFQYPSWYILFCVLLGLAVALLLYYRDTSFKEQAPILRWLLGGLRFLAVTLLSMLLLSPLLKSLLTETKKPIVVLAQDQSESVMAGISEEERATYQQNFKELSTSLAQSYDLKEYAFGGQVREGVDFVFDDKVTNISDFLKTMYDLYSNQNLGAVILATDGIYNEGSNPIYTSTKLAAPIYTVALGDTTPKRDLIVKRVFHNKIAYLGDKFSIQIDVAAQNCAGTNSTLTVTKVRKGGNQVLQKIPVVIDKNDFFATKEVVLDADVAGVQRYRISLNKVTDEATVANNTKDIFVDVLDARQKILILANTPHPDVSAFKQSMDNNKNYEVTTKYINAPSLNIAAYDFVVLHQLPSKTNDAAGVLSTLRTNKIAHLFVVGTQTDLGKLNTSQNVVSISGDGRNTNDVQASISGDFSLFTIDEDFRKELPTFNPLAAPFGEYKLLGNAQAFLYQRIGKVDTKYPLLAFGEREGVKTGVLTAEGIWKWRLFDYLQHKNHDLYENLMGKTIQYLSVKEDKRKFRVSINKNIFNENEPLFFDAELYNESYERINDPDVNLVITDSEGKNYDFIFNKTAQSYTLDAGLFAVGNYTFEGSTFADGEKLTYKGQFSVRPIQLESFETTADHALLQLLSEKFGGKVVSPTNVASLASVIAEQGTVKPVIYQTTKTRSIINVRWICFLLIGLLVIEWFVRRYFGSY